jgi:hypothetical protein
MESDICLTNKRHKELLHKLRIKIPYLVCRNFKSVSKIASAGYINGAKRGVYVTNDYNTVVIQDEVDAKNIETMYWIGHYKEDAVEEVKLSDDQRTVYMISTNNDGEEIVLRISIVSDHAGDRFKDIDTYHNYLGQEGFLLDSTHSPTYSLENGGRVNENDRSGIRRLVIQRRGFGAKFAVVFEIVDVVNSKHPVGYEWIDMKDWGKEENLPHRDDRFDDVVDDGSVGYREEPSFKQINVGLIQIENVYNKDRKSYTSNLYKFYRTITDFHYNYYDFIGMTTEEVAKKHDRIVRKFNAFVNGTNAGVKSSKAITEVLFGI